jgi:DinB superfamily
MTASASVDSLVSRLSDVERRLAEHAARPLPPGLTDPDPGGEERWEAGQVWAHLAEFPAYWLGQAQRVVGLPTNEPVPFGRVKTDAVRVAAIERDRHTDPAALLERVRSSLAEITDAARTLPPDAWRLRGMHPTRGEMTVEQIFETFIANHLEEHADQLDTLERPRST